MRKYSVLLICLLFLQCRNSKITISGTSASITKEGFIDCFEKNLSASGKPVWCEASAILFDGNKFFVANDKEMPGNRSSVFYWASKNDFADTSASAQYLINPLLKKGIKYEDFALTPDGKYAVLSTAFDRIKVGSSEWNGYNSLIFWKIGNEVNPQIISISGSDSTSVSYRDAISKVLVSDSFKDGMPYFKLEGIAATKDKIYWGVREEGKKYDDFNYKTKIITVSYKIENEKFSLGTDFTVLADIDIKSLQPSLPEKMGLSSIEYDKYHKRFLILTSYENGEKIGGYLWTASLKELKQNKMTLVTTTDGKPVTFAHKPEDVTIINANKIMIIHDDDRIKTFVGNQQRTENQAAYSLVEFK